MTTPEVVEINYCFDCETPVLTKTAFLDHGRVKGHRVQVFKLKRRYRRPGEVQWSTDWEPER